MTSAAHDAGFVTELWLSGLLSEYEKTEVIISKFSVGRGCQPSEGFLSDLLACTVEAVVNRNGGMKKKFELMLKSLPSDEKMREMVTKAGFHENESQFYTVVVPALQGLVDNYGKSLYKLPVPEFFAVTGVEDNEEQTVIVMGNMKESVPVWKGIPLDIGIDADSYTVVCKSLTKIHAVPLAMRANIGAESISAVIPGWKGANYDPDVFETHLANGFRDLETFLKQNRPGWTAGGEDWQNLKSMTKFGMENPKVSMRLETVCHADIWNGNLLFRVVPATGKPESCLIIDWQMAFASSPALDLCNLLFFCSRFVSEEEFHQKLREYWDLLDAALMNFDVNLEKDLQYTWADFLHDLPVSMSLAAVNWVCSTEMMFAYACDDVNARILSWYDYLTHKDWSVGLIEWMHSV